MSSIRIRPRSAIADADLARVATVDLPGSVTSGTRSAAPRAVLRAVAAFRRSTQPERVIVMNLVPAPARRR